MPPVKTGRCTRPHTGTTCGVRCACSASTMVLRVPFRMNTARARAGGRAEGTGQAAAMPQRTSVAFQARRLPAAAASRAASARAPVPASPSCTAAVCSRRQITCRPLVPTCAADAEGAGPKPSQEGARPLCGHDVPHGGHEGAVLGVACVVGEGLVGAGTAAGGAGLGWAWGWREMGGPATFRATHPLPQ